MEEGERETYSYTRNEEEDVEGEDEENMEELEAMLYSLSATLLRS